MDFPLEIFHRLRFDKNRAISDFMGFLLEGNSRILRDRGKGPSERGEKYMQIFLWKADKMLRPFFVASKRNGTGKICEKSFAKDEKMCKKPDCMPLFFRILTESL